MFDKLFIILFLVAIFFNLVKVLVTFINRVKNGAPAEKGSPDSLAKAFNLERCRPTAVTNRTINALAGIPDSLRGNIAGYHVMVDFSFPEESSHKSQLVPQITFHIPDNKSYHFNITQRGLLTNESEDAVKTCCPDFDKCFTISGLKGYHSAAYLNEDVRKVLLAYFRKGKVDFSSGKLTLSLRSFTLDDWIKAVNDMLSLTDHLTANLDILQALTHVLFTDSSEGARVNAMVQLKKMGLLHNLKERLPLLSENPNHEIAVLAAGELGREKIPLLLNILKTERGKKPPYRVDPPFIAADYLKDYLDDRRVSETFYQIFQDTRLASRVKSDEKYSFILQLLTEEKDSQSIPHIVESLPLLSGRLKKNSPFKKRLLNYLDALEVKESNSWLLKELDNGSSEEKLIIIKLLGKLNQSTSLEQLERYSKSPLASKEIREAAVQAMGEIY